MNFLYDIKNAFNKANIVEKIIYVNVAFFLVTVLFSNFMYNWFALPTTFFEFITKPWTAISYAFIHQRLLHILSNLIILYYIGNLFLDFFNKKQFVNFYFLGALIGATAYLIYYFILDKNGSNLGGASAAVTAIFVGVATKIPRYALHLRFIGSIELWVLATIWVVLSLLQISGPNSGAAIAHLGGGLFGYIYAKQLNIGNDIGKWFENFLNYFFGLFKQQNKSNLKTVHKSNKRSTKTYEEKSKQQKINEILDKISKSGYESLSQDEKDFLFRAGKK